jgi:exosome complex RNA-binding protein Rrp42 (RNase PH superfamily)
VKCPPPNRPSEGQIFFNLELSPMASPAYETGRYDFTICGVSRAFYYKNFLLWDLPG